MECRNEKNVCSSRKIIDVRLRGRKGGERERERERERN